MARILIFGDSFACSNPRSWCEMLASEHEVINYAQAGSSEYRIWQQWQQHNDRHWDHAVICHTSANRLYCAENFFHDITGIHKNSDLIYQDIKSRQGLPAADHVIWWFENVFDLDQARFMHCLLLEHWIRETAQSNVYHMTFFDSCLEKVDNLHHIWHQYPGDVNHLNDQGNVKTANLVKANLSRQRIR